MITRLLTLIPLTLLTLVLVLAPTTARAQSVPGPRVSLVLERPQVPSCENPTNLNAWNFTYGSCYLPAGVALGDPWISGIRVTFTGTTTVSTVVPRGQVVLETAAARCSGASVPCLRINDLPAPVGPSQITARFVSGEGTDGGPSAAVPFTGTATTVPAATGLRVVVP